MEGSKFLDLCANQTKSSKFLRESRLRMTKKKHFNIGMKYAVYKNKICNY